MSDLSGQEREGDPAGVGNDPVNGRTHQMPDGQTSPGTRDQRTIRVFVSSTFRDMQAERDILSKKIFPQLRKLCEERAVSWTEVDLRWGITDEEKAEGKVLPLCLAEIERCRPWFISLLGARYGWELESVPAEAPSAGTAGAGGGISSEAGGSEG